MQILKNKLMYDNLSIKLINVKNALIEMSLKTSL